MTNDKPYIEKVYPKNDNATQPVILKFQNGKLASAGKELAQYSAALHKDKNVTAAVVTVNGHIYHGITTSGKDLTDSYICVRNRTTNKVRIIPVDQVLLRNHVYNVLEKETNLQKMSKETSALTLLKQFGGRKANRSLISAKNMQVNVDFVKDDLDNTVKDANIEEENNENETSQFYDRIRPKFNEAAKALSEVYQVTDLVPQNLLDRLDEEATMVHSTPVENLPITSEYLKSCIKNLQEATLSPEHSLHIKLIIYIDALINMLRTRVRRFDKIKLSEITEKVGDNIRSSFRDPNSPKNPLRTSFSNEKGLCYLIVLVVLISKDYQIGIDTLAQELCMPKNRIVKFANLVCVRRIPKTEKFALKLPSKITFNTPAKRGSRFKH